MYFSTPGDSKWPFGMASSRDPKSKANGDLQLGDKKVTLNHLLDACNKLNPPKI